MPGAGAGGRAVSPGIGLVAGPYGPAVTALGAVLRAVAVALVPLPLLCLQRHDERVPWLYLLDGGIVLTRPPPAARVRRSR